MKKKNFKFIFNDRAFEDNWAEPYIVEVITSREISIEDFRNLVEKTIKKIENSEDGFLCSEEGIKQIFSDLKDLIANLYITQYDYNFQFGVY